MRTRLLQFVAVLALLPLPALAQATNRVPPLGLELAAEDRRVLLAGSDELGAEIGRLRLDAAKVESIPDVEIFHKAVRWAVVNREVYRTNEIAIAKKLLQQGLERARSLGQGKTPWLAATGLVVGAYVSRLDDSVQPYGLVVPASFAGNSKRRFRLDVWLHGRDNSLTELKFLNDRQRSAGEFAPVDTFVLHPYGRYCNAFKFAGESDVFEAMAEVCKRYPIDLARVSIRGFSMGGAGAWHLAAHYPGVWAAAAPGAGFAETAEYSQIFKRGLNPPLYEQALWRWYDATRYAANFRNCPVIAYSGELDKQRQAADMMAKAMKEEGLELRQLIGPKVEHRYELATKAELDREITKIAAAGKPAFPDRVRFTTYTLRYNSNNWITLDGLEKHWERADVDAERLPDLGMLRMKTKNVSALSVEPPPGKLDLVLDNNIFPWAQVFGGGAARLEKVGKSWRVAHEVPGLRKRHGVQGPIDDAFMDRFVMVRPTGTAFNSSSSAWVQRELARATNEWRAQFRGVARVKADNEITSDDVAKSHLILWGDPQSNQVLARVLRDLPLRWEREGFRIGGKRFGGDQFAPVLIFPNPLNPNRYVVVNSGFTFADAGSGSNAQQTPKLPDYAVLEIGAPGKVALAGFFDERWRLPN